MELSSIKLIIWDLDDTLWSGTLSEGDVVLSKDNIQLIKDLTDCGIINSICSKNDYEQVKGFLSRKELWDFFVFPSINWESKGPQVSSMLDKMALRPANVLFIDDNASNRGEVHHYIPAIQVEDPSIIGVLREQVTLLDKKDIHHKRLNQYKILETKDIEAKNYGSNEDFLYDSCIRVNIFKNCLEQIQRIHELLMRSNQLNFTKKRISIDELESILVSHDFDCGYVTVQDRFGDYGLIGFYALKEGELEHFFFSCRTMGQKIEQWVYAQLGFPKLTVQGEVRTQLNQTDCPGWINYHKPLNKSIESNSLGTIKPCRVLLKGPCDLSHSQVYIKGSGNIVSEFTYVNDKGQIIDAYNHSVHIEGLHTYSEKEKQEIVQDCQFVDPEMLSGSFFTGQYDVIFLSTLIESSYRIYKKKNSRIRVVFGGHDLTNPDNWSGYLSGAFYNGQNTFTIDYLRSFSEKYDCVGKTTPEMYLVFLQKCLDWLPCETSLCLILGATRVYAYEDEAKEEHKKLNEAIKSFSKENPRIKYIEIDDCIHDTSDFEGGINHFSTRVYYEISQRIIQIIRDATGNEVDSFSKGIIIFDNVVLLCRRLVKRLFGERTFVYRNMKRVYNRLYKHRT
jgi:FkbH-like protein